MCECVLKEQLVFTTFFYVPDRAVSWNSNLIYELKCPNTHSYCKGKIKLKIILPPPPPPTQKNSHLMERMVEL